VTSDEILSMKPGPGLDESIGKLIGATPAVKWYAMNKNETAYFMDFECRRMAQEWHAEITGKYKNHRYSSGGGHIVRKEFYRKYSTDISAAWVVRQHIHETIGGTQIISVCDDNPELCKIWNGKKYIEARGETVPHAICLSLLLAAENKKCS